MNMRTRTLLATPVVAVLVTAAPARSAPDVDALYETVAPRAAALGGADAAGPVDATAAFGNPAGLAFLHGNGFVGAHRADAPGTMTQSGAFTWHAPAAPAGVALRACLENRAGTPAQDALGRARSPDAGWRAGAAAAFVPWRGVALGVAVDRFRTLPVAAKRVVGWSADAGVAWQGARTGAGAFVRGLTWDAASGARRAWSAGVTREVTQHAQVLLQADGDAQAAVRLGGGVAVAAGRYLEVRAGARDAEGSRWGTAGVGVGTRALRVDYAVRAARAARTEHQLAIVFGFGLAPLPVVDGGGGSGPLVEDGTAPPPVVAVPALDEPPVAVPVVPGAKVLPATESAAGSVFVVRAGPFKTLEAAAREVSRLYAANVRPSIQQEGESYFVVVQRCTARADAEAWQKRAREAGVRCDVRAEPISAPVRP